MKKFMIYPTLLLTICFICNGCNNKDIKYISDNNIPSSVAVKEKNVIQIDVQIKSDNHVSTKSYSDSSKIEKICGYIRELTWDDLQGENPDHENGAEYMVTYINEDNTTKVYYFKEDNYFKTDNFDWKVIANLNDLKDLIAN